VAFFLITDLHGSGLRCYPPSSSSPPTLPPSDAALPSRLLFAWFDPFVSGVPSLAHKLLGGGSGVAPAQRVNTVAGDELPHLQEKYRSVRRRPPLNEIDGFLNYFFSNHAHLLYALIAIFRSGHLLEEWQEHARRNGAHASFNRRERDTLRLILALSKGNILASAGLELARIVLSLLATYALQLLIGYLDVSDEEEGAHPALPWHGLAKAGALVALGLLCSLAETHSFFQLNVAGLKAKSAVAAAVFRKAMAVKQPRGACLGRTQREEGFSYAKTSKEMLI